MKTRTELMTELLEKADWLIENADMCNTILHDQWHDKQNEYTRLRAELAEVKDRSADRLNEIICNLESEVDESIGREDEDYEKSWPYQTGILLCRKEVNEIIQYLHQFASQSPKMPTEEIRHAFALYVKSEGCDCCRDTDAHNEAEGMLAKLLNAEHYSDGNGYDWSKYE